MTLQEDLLNLDFASLCSAETVVRYQARIAEGKLTREENLTDHLCAYFLPYNPATRSIFLIDHKKSGLWLTPGGHVDVGERLLDVPIREAAEELGITLTADQLGAPFLLTVTEIVQDVRPCKRHYDIWFKFDTDGKDFVVDYTECNDARWLTLSEARSLVKDPGNLAMLEKLVEMKML